MKLLYALLFIGMAFSGENLSAQGCCTAGSPSLGGLQTGLSPAGRMTYALTYESTRLASAYRGSEQIADRLGRKAIVNNVSVEFGYRLGARLGMNLIGNFSSRSREVNLGNAGVFNSKGSGVGDLVALLKFDVLPLELAHQRELAVGVGLKAPVGRFRIEQEGVRLSYDLHPGTGSWDPLLWLYAFKGFLPRRYNFFASFAFRFPGANPDGYRIGREVTYYLGGSYRCCNPFDLILQIRGRHTGKDVYLSRQRASTGGTWFFAAPAVNLNLLNQVALQIQYQHPLYFRVNGEQLAPDRTVALALFYRI